MQGGDVPIESWPAAAARVRVELAGLAWEADAANSTPVVPLVPHGLHAAVLPLRAPLREVWRGVHIVRRLLLGLAPSPPEVAAEVVTWRLGDAMLARDTPLLPYATLPACLQHAHPPQSLVVTAPWPFQLRWQRATLTAADAAAVRTLRLADGSGDDAWCASRVVVPPMALGAAPMAPIPAPKLLFAGGVVYSDYDAATCVINGAVAEQLHTHASA